MLPEAFAPAAEQPYEVDLVIADDIFAKQVHVPKAKTYLPQHEHAYDHATLLARGAIRVWIDGEDMGEYRAPKPIFIAAKKRHIFLTLEDDTVLYCIHNISRAGSIEVHREHHLVDGG